MRMARSLSVEPLTCRRLRSLSLESAIIYHSRRITPIYQLPVGDTIIVIEAEIGMKFSNQAPWREHKALKVLLAIITLHRRRLREL